MPETPPPDPRWLDDEARRSLGRLVPRARARLDAEGASEAWVSLERRLDAHFPRLFAHLHALYDRSYDFFFHLEELLVVIARSWLERPNDLRELDVRREHEPDWFRSERLLGAACYVDLFAGDLRGLAESLGYLKALGVSYLHLMPLFRCPQGRNDGGYAVSSYREVAPRLGSMAQLASLSRELRRSGISLALDFVFNHTSDEHEWARRARAGERHYQDFYRTFPDRELPDAYDRTLREIFPDEHPGGFTWDPELQRWVWTSFHSFQWDLNYENPAVFTAMAGELLFLANAGAEVLRLDAIAFTWKQLGTPCESLPHAHTLARAFNAVARIAAPALAFKSEAIVHPDDVASYVDPEECQLSYDPLLMALLWNSLATRKTRLLSRALERRMALPPGCAWVNYVRGHDDIGWTFSDEDAAALGVNAGDHRRFLNDFYTGRFPGSFARGAPFQENPRTGDTRISGTCASLAGLEKALAERDDAQIELAIRRIVLLHAVIASAGGPPVLYVGDEIGTLNDYGYHADPDRAGDSRWVHRPAMDWTRARRRNDPTSPEGRIWGALRELFATRARHPAFAAGPLQAHDPHNPHTLAYVREAPRERLLCVFNFSEREQRVSAGRLPLGGREALLDLVTGDELACDPELRLDPYRFSWLVL